MLRNFALVFSTFLLLPWVSFASSDHLETKTIEQIKIQGNRKIETEAIRSHLSSREGELYLRENIREDVQSIFEMGFFFDVQVDAQAGNKTVNLTYFVVEKPSIGEIIFVGNEEIDDDEIREASAIKPFEILNMTKIQQAVEKIQKLYEDKGFFLAKVTFELEDIKEGETKRLKLIVQENDKVKIKKITILGNSEIGDNYLKSRIQTKEGGLFSFMSGSGAYKQDDFDRDIQILQFLYFNEGYIQAKIDTPEVYVTPDKKSIYITIKIQEGLQYNVGKIDFSGDMLFEDKELYDAIEIDKSKIFVWEKLQKDLRTLQAKYGDLGYAFANVIPRTRIREKDREVDVTFEFDKGNKVYFGKINVVGNSKTRDKVVRRELRIFEGELYNETAKRESLANVRRLGYFEEVNFNTSTPVDQPDVLNVDVTVKERNTGTIQVGAGYSSFSGLIFNGQVNQTNFLGRGQRLGVSLDISERSSLFNLSFTEPYFLDTRWLLGVNAFRSRRIFTNFEETKTGGAFRVGHPLAEYLRGIIQYKLDDTEVELDSDGDEDLFPVETVNGITSSLTFTLEYDKRNDRFAPTKGVFSSASVEYAGLGGDLEYTKLISTFRFYKNVFWDVIWRNNLSYGLITSNNSNEPPFNELFLLGGANSLRGFDFFSIGREKFSQKFCDTQSDCDGEGDPDGLRPFGGKQQIFLQTEFEFPLIQEAGIKGVLFFDVGDANDTFVGRNLRSDFGFGFRWFSPIGPLRFEWGFPIARRDDEESVNFQFAIGSPF